MDKTANDLLDNGQYVTDISIVELSALKAEDGSYGLDITWELNGGRYRDCDAKYELDLFYGGEKSETCAVEVDKADYSSGTVRGIKPDLSNKDKAYSASLIYIKNSERRESDKVELPIYGFSDLKGEYRDGSLNISWEKSYDNCPYIFCDVYSDNGLKQIYEVSKGNTNIQISVPPTTCTLPLNADVYSSDGDGICGVVQKLRFFPRGITVDSFDREGDSLNLEFALSCSDEESKEADIYFCAVKDNAVLKSSDKASLTSVSSGKYKASLGSFFSELLPSCAESSRLGGVLEYHGAKTIVFGTDCLPLAAPALKAAEYVRGGVRLTAEYPSNTPIAGFLGDDGKMYYSSEIEVKSADSASFAVRPVFRVDGRECKGISSDKIPSSHEFFCVEADENKNLVIYYSQNAGGSEAVCEFENELFSAHLNEGISSEKKIITLEPCAENGVLYRLKLDGSALLTAENNNSELNGFYKKLFGIKSGSILNNITPSGFYMLCGVISRMCRCKLSDVCVISRNFIPASRYCAVLPGDTLRVETSIYTEQTNSYIENYSGYTLTNTSEYLAALNDAGLVFDPFVSAMSSGMSVTNAAAATLNWRLSGITDLAVNAQNPYMYLMYPVNYYAPDMPVSVYPYDNTFLIGNNDYSTLLDNIKDIAESPAHAKDADGVVYFNGRSSVTILISVFVNGQRRRVPVGTSIYELLTGYGYFGAEFKLYRLNARREYCPVFIGDGVSRSEILLLSEDKIEV